MCGRFTLRTPTREIATLFHVEPIPLEPRYNIAPSQPVAAVRLRPDGTRELVELQWGLVPSWADDPKIGNRMINARAETVATKPSFRSAFRKRRCLVLADGFYEWQKRDGSKQPFYIRMRDDHPFGFAGLWETWRRDANRLETCTIITTDANALMRPIHDRMPVIIPPDAYDLWLDPEFEDAEKLASLLVPYPEKPMEAYPIGTRVNNPRNESPECIAPLGST